MRIMVVFFSTEFHGIFSQSSGVATGGARGRAPPQPRPEPPMRFMQIRRVLFGGELGGMSDGIVIDYHITYIMLLYFLPIKSRFSKKNIMFLNHDTWLANSAKCFLVKTVFFSGDPPQTHSLYLFTDVMMMMMMMSGWNHSIFYFHLNLACLLATDQDITCRF